MTTGKLTKRKLQAINTKKEIYKAALSLLAEEGFENLTIEKIGRRAGVSVGTFYHYYKTKNDILEEVFQRGDEYFRKHVENNIAGSGAIERIVSYFDHFAKFYIANGVDVTKALYTTHIIHFADDTRLMWSILQKIVNEGRARKELTTTLEPREITDILFIAARGLAYNWCMNNGEYPLDQAMHKYMVFVSRALLP